MSEEAKAQVSAVTTDTLIGEHIGRNYAADVASVTAETLIGERFGRAVIADIGTVVTDALTGERVGREIMADVGHVLFEALVKEPALTISHVLAEAIVSLPDDPLAPTHKTAQLFEIAAQGKATSDPANVISPVTVAGVVTFTAADREVSIPLSPDDVPQLVQEATLERLLGPIEEMISAIDVHRLTSMAAVSRGKAYQPQSYVSVASIRFSATAQRQLMPPEEYRSPNQANQVVTLVAASVKLPAPGGGIEVGQLAQMLIADRPLEPHLTPQFVGQAAQLLVQARVMPAFGPRIEVAQNVQLLSRQRAVPAAHSPADVGTVVALTVEQRSAEFPMSQAILGSQAQLATQGRDVPHPIEVVGMNVSAVFTEAAKFRPTPIPPTVVSATRVGQVRVQFVQWRKTPRPEDVIDPSVGAHAGQLALLGVQHRAVTPLPDPFEGQRRLHALNEITVLRDKLPPPPEEPTDLPDARISLLLEAAVVRDGSFLPLSYVHLPLMAEVCVLNDMSGLVDPTKPLSDAGLHEISETTVLADLGPWTDPTVPQSANSVNELAASVVMGDTSPPPADLPLSEASAIELSEHVILTDGENWLNPAVPHSTAMMSELAESVALADTSLLPADLPLSKVSMIELSGHVALADGDGWLDPTVPQSEAAVGSLTEYLVAEDGSYPPGDSVLSLGQLGVLGQPVVMEDRDQANVPIGSPAQAATLAQFVISRDPWLLKLPTRRTSIRPVISISIT